MAYEIWRAKDLTRRAPLRGARGLSPGWPMRNGGKRPRF